MKRVLPSLATLALVSTVAAQVYTPPPQGGGSKPPAANQGGDTVINRPAKENNGGGSVVGNELPFYDPSAETVSFNGHTWAATDNRLFAARFERYLNEPEERSEAAKEYRETIDAILETISPNHAGGPNLYGAFRLLPKASIFPADAKLCDSLAQAIYTAMLSKKEIAGTQKLMESMEEEKQRIIRNGDIMAEGAAVGQKQPAGGGGGGGGGRAGQGQTRGGNNPRTGTGIDSLEYKDYVRRIVEIEAIKKANLAKSEVSIVQAKIQYQALMVQLFLQRRFQHVLMASRFYTLIWRDGDNNLRIDKNSDMAKMFTEGLGVSPTVATLDSLASEAIRDVDKGVEAFQFLAEKGELESASKRLSESYAVGEFMPAIRVLPRDQKRKILEYVRESYKLIAALDSKDYTTANALIEKLGKMATDFEATGSATKAKAAIATYTRVSDMHIMTAKNHLAANEPDKAREEIQKAMEVWPQNPKLAEFDRLVEAGGTVVQARNDFDRLLSEQNFREIFKRQYEFAPAIQNDRQRVEAFQQIIANLTRIEAALGKAAEFSKMGQDYAAWEQLAELRTQFPDDPKLGRDMELLAPKVADFTKALDRARQFEERSPKQTGSALAWFLKARSIYPQSTVADAGIRRSLDEILPEDSPTTEIQASSQPVKADEGIDNRQ